MQTDKDILNDKTEEGTVDALHLIQFSVPLPLVLSSIVEFIL